MVEKKNKDRLRRSNGLFVWMILQNYHHSIGRVIVAIVLSAVSGRIHVNVFENDPSSTIKDLWIGLLWAIVSITTTDYGSYMPMTTGAELWSSW